ncbi:MAG TPA: SGNH/GDSL hydrolase family protein [Bryobacteraceae bacterium]|nr:SGNH/GDSL hydrolase family protein [Bryobacteraceae bacterium]
MIVKMRMAGVLAFMMSMSLAHAANEKSYTYLALGDSIAFGLDPLLLPPLASTLPDPSQFVGYPERVAEVKKLLKSKKLVNASCPGESSGSFWDSSKPDLGCNGPGPQGQPPFKTTIGLRTNYQESQLDFAKAQLLANKHINLVTISIGGNDLSMLEAKCANPVQLLFTQCVAAGLPGVLAEYGANLTRILKGIREDANYSGKLVLVTCYSPNANPLFISAVVALNQVARLIALPYGVKIAEGFTAFQLASILQGGDPCTAGLLIPLPSGGCDIHPTPKGRDLLAATVLVAIQ